MKQWSMVNYSKLIQHEKNKKSLCESEVEGVWEDECILWSNNDDDLVSRDQLSRNQLSRDQLSRDQFSQDQLKFSRDQLIRFVVKSTKWVTNYIKSATNVILDTKSNHKVLCYIYSIHSEMSHCSRIESSKHVLNSSLLLPRPSSSWGLLCSSFQHLHFHPFFPLEDINGMWFT